jgi:hypothetical protein
LPPQIGCLSADEMYCLLYHTCPWLQVQKLKIMFRHGPKIFSWYMHIEIENPVLSTKFTIHHDPSTVVRSQWVAVPHKSQEQACWDHRQRWHTFPQDMAHIHPSFSCPAYYQLLPRHTSTVLHNLHDTNNIMNVQCKHMDIENIHEDQSLA